MLYRKKSGHYLGAWFAPYALRSKSSILFPKLAESGFLGGKVRKKHCF